MAESENNKSKVQEFVKGLKAEFRKIIWPTQERLTREVIAGLCVSLVLGLLISFLDWIFQLGLTSVLS